MPQESESRSLDKVIVRLPDGLRDRLKAAAASNNRSMNAEIVARLEASFDELEELRAQAVRDDEIFTQFHRNQEAMLKQISELSQRLDKLQERRNERP